MPRHALLIGWGLLTVALYLMVWNRESLYLLAIASLLLTVLLVGVALPWLAIATTRLTLHPPQIVNDQAPEFLEIAARNYFLWPHDGLVMQIALSSKQSGHRRYFPLPLPRLYPGSRTLRIPLPALPRGRYRFAEARMTATQPFGFVRFERPVVTESGAIVVRPRRFSLPARHWLEGALMRFSGQSPQGRAGYSSEFFGVREYRPGDSPRHINWKASARQGELIVREFEDIAQPELLVVVDAHHTGAATAEHRQKFEEGIRIAASAAQAALRAGLAVGLRSQAMTLASATGDLQGWRLLEAFTDIQADADTPLHAALAPLLQRGLPAQTVLVIAPVDTAEWKALQSRLLQLAASGHQLHVVLTSNRSEAAEAAATMLRGRCRRVEIIGTRAPETLLA